MRALRILLAGVSLLVCSVFARADEARPPRTPTLFEVLEMRGIPQELHAKDLTAAWRVMRLSSSVDGDALATRQALAMGGQLQADVVYTRGETLSLSGQSFLVAYQLKREFDPQTRQARRFQRTEKPDTRIPENSLLTLSLLNLTNTNNFVDIRSFNPARELVTEQERLQNKVRDDRADSQDNLKQIALAVKQYVQDYDELLPPMRAARSADEVRGVWKAQRYWPRPVQEVLMPYIKSAEAFLHPTTGRPYLPNWRISRKNIDEIPAPATTVLFYEDAPDADRLRNVAFVDGHVEALYEEKWKKLARENKLPP